MWQKRLVIVRWIVPTGRSSGRWSVFPGTVRTVIEGKLGSRSNKTLTPLATPDASLNALPPCQHCAYDCILKVSRTIANLKVPGATAPMHSAEAVASMNWDLPGSTTGQWLGHLSFRKVSNGERKEQLSDGQGQRRERSAASQTT